MSQSHASDPGKIRLSEYKLKILRPDLYGLQALWRSAQEKMGKKSDDEIGYITRVLERGDSRAAVVVSTEPLLVAAYTDEMDCVAVLKFPQNFVSVYALEVGSRLLTVNFYGELPLSADLIAGPRDFKRWGRFHPAIADFLSDDLERIATRKAEISEGEWARCFTMGQEYLKLKPKVARDGRPGKSNQPAVPYE